MKNLLIISLLILTLGCVNQRVSFYEVKVNTSLVDSSKLQLVALYAHSDNQCGELFYHHDTLEVDDDFEVANTYIKIEFNSHNSINGVIDAFTFKDIAVNKTSDYIIYSQFDSKLALLSVNRKGIEVLNSSVQKNILGKYISEYINIITYKGKEHKEVFTFFKKPVKVLEFSSSVFPCN